MIAQELKVPLAGAVLAILVIGTGIAAANVKPIAKDPLEASGQVLGESLVCKTQTEIEDLAIASYLIGAAQMCQAMGGFFAMEENDQPACYVEQL